MWFGEDFRKWCEIMKSMDEGRREGIHVKGKLKTGEYMYMCSRLVHRP